MPEDLFARKKPIIAMAHLGLLPGVPGYDAKDGIDALIAAVAADVDKLQASGVDPIMFGNEADRPYLMRASPDRVKRFMARVEELR
jgi:predicted TIM-barrel enzyme